MILRSPPSGSGLVSYVVLILVLGGCAREEPTRATLGAAPARAAADVSASESVEVDSANSVVPADEPVRSPSRDPAKLRQAAMAALQAGDQDVAFDLGRQAMRVAPDDPQVIFLMAMILGERNRFPESIQMLDDLAATTPDARLPAMGQTADWLVRYGKWAEAEDRYRAILKEVPASGLAHRKLAELLIRQGRRVSAADHLRMLCQLGDIQENELRCLLSLLHPFPGDAEQEDFDPVGVLGIARNEIARGDWQAARERLQALDSPQAEERALLARIHVHFGDFEALGPWPANVASSTDLHPDAWFARGADAAQMGDQVTAIRCFAEVVLRDQTDHEAYFLMSQSLEKLDAIQEAEEARRRAELIQQTKALGAEMSAATSRDQAKLSAIVDQLDRLHRPLEALAWRGVQLAYAPANSSMSDTELQQAIDDISRERSETLRAGRDQASRSFLLCGIDVDAFTKRADQESRDHDGDSP